MFAWFCFTTSIILKHHEYTSAGQILLIVGAIGAAIQIIMLIFSFHERSVVRNRQLPTPEQVRRYKRINGLLKINKLKPFKPKKQITHRSSSNPNIQETIEVDDRDWFTRWVDNVIENF